MAKKKPVQAKGKYRASGERAPRRDPNEVRDEQARAESTDQEASQRLQAALAKYGLHLGGNAEANYRDLRDAWLECLDEAVSAVTGKVIKHQTKQEAFAALVPQIQMKKLVVFPNTVPAETAAPPATATSKKTAQTEDEDTTMATKKTSSTKKKAAPKKATPVKAKTTAKSGTQKESAAAMFKRLITEGKLNDDQIFAQVQKAHGLDDSKRSYVAWYRRDLAKTKVAKKK